MEICEKFQKQGEIEMKKRGYSMIYPGLYPIFVDKDGNQFNSVKEAK